MRTVFLEPCGNCMTHISSHTTQHVVFNPLSLGEEITSKTEGSFRASNWHKRFSYNNHQTNPIKPKIMSKGCVKPNGQMLKPVFDDTFSSDLLINSVSELRSKRETISHNEILQKLIEQFEPIDFQALANPEVEKLKNDLKTVDPNSEQATEIRKKLDKCKVTIKQYRILSIDNVNKVAEENRWGLCKKHEYIYLYNGTFWSEVEKESFQKFLGEAAEQMGIRWDYAQDYIFREQLFKQFLAVADLPAPKNDKETVLINLLNGTFEINSLERKLRPFNPADFITYQLPFIYDPQAEAPLFKVYLDRVLPDKESQRVLAEYLGSVFIKNGGNIIKEEKALILYGSGANGKSVFFEIINALLGKENIGCYSLQSLTEGNGYHRAKLANMLVNYASEINGKLETSIFKQLVSGEPVEARLPYGQPFLLRQYAKLIFNCNTLPKDVEHSHAYFRRFLIIPFDVTIPEEEQDKRLHTKIIENELSGVFNWVLEGLTRLLKQERFSDCEAASRALEQYKTESNSLKMFLEDNGYQKSLDDFIRFSELFTEYKNYCFEDVMHPFKKKNFSKQLQSMGIRMDRQAGSGQCIVFLGKAK